MIFSFLIAVVITIVAVMVIAIAEVDITATGYVNCWFPCVGPSPEPRAAPPTAVTVNFGLLT